MPGDSITQLMGISVEHARVKILKTNFEEEGPVLITHWGMSGPAVLKLSSRAARTLAGMNYHFKVQVNWIPKMKEDELRKTLLGFKKDVATKLVINHNSFSLPKRLWEHLTTKAGIRDNLQWAQFTKEHLNNLLNILLSNEFEVKGKTTFREEFVTCGGVELSEVDFKTMQSKKMKGLYFAGEVLDIDAVTGGFNFQSAWTTGFIAAQSMGK
jgi:predicted Rossmann fold flavoprotein